jgi:hypothetical protein
MEIKNVKKAVSLWKRHYRKSFGVAPTEEVVEQHQRMLESQED